MRCPSPDFTTACATRNATTTSSTLVLANPANAFAGEMVPVITTAATASVVEVSSGNAPIRTAVMAETNTANRCHAGVVSPAGTGEKAIPSARTKGKARLTSKPRLSLGGAGFSVSIAGAADLRGTVAGLVMIADLRYLIVPVLNQRARVPSGRQIRLAYFRPRTRVQSARRIRMFPWRPHNALSRR